MKSESPPAEVVAEVVELLLFIVLVVLQAAAVLTAALVALLLTITRSRPAGSPARVMPAPPPAPLLHPLALVAEELEALPATALRELAGTRSKRIRKALLVALVAAC
jgi:hypothetical protein